MATKWDKMLSDAGQAGQKIGQAVKHEADVIIEHNVKTPAKVGQAVAHEASVVAEHNKGIFGKIESAVEGVFHHAQGTVQNDALDVLKNAEAEAASIQSKAQTDAKAQLDAAVAAIHARAGEVEGPLKDALTKVANEVQTGVSQLDDQLKAELAKVGVKL